MAIHHLTPPVRGGERPRLPSTQVGPVTQAIRAMRAADSLDMGHAHIEDSCPEATSCSPANPDLDRQRIRDMRRRISERIEADLALLDALDGDADAEPSLGSIDVTSYSDWMSQERWSIGGGQDREAGDDNGLGDYDALSEQGFPGYGRCA